LTTPVIVYEKIDVFLITIKEEQAEKKFNRTLGVLGTIIAAVGLFSIIDYLPNV